MHGRGEKSVWWKSLKERDHLEDQGKDERMGSKWFLGRLAGRGRNRVNPVCSGYGPVVGSCKYGDEPSGSGATELVSYCSYQVAILYEMIL
jgi:hypothetical protein